MGIVSGLKNLFSTKGASTLDLFREVYGGNASKTGVSVSWKNALEVSTVLACCRVIANGVSQVPFRVYQKTATGTTVADIHSLYRVIYRKPNPLQTSFQFRETIMFHVLLTGNAFIWKGMVGRDRKVRVLEIIEPHRVSVERLPNGSVSYTVTADDSSQVKYGQETIWHIKGPSWNSWMGLEATKLAREAIGLSISTEQAHADFHRNGARTSGMLTVSGVLSPERYEKLQASLDRRAQGHDWAGKPLVMDSGANYVPFQMTGVDAQHLETRKHQIEEICRAFGVMPIMVGHADKTATYASAEQMFLAHVVHTLSPWYERLEQSADANLLSEADLDAGYYTKFTPNGLMRGAAKDRAEFYAKALGSGGSSAWMTQNEVRALEEMDAMTGGEELFKPVSAAASEPDDEAKSIGALFVGIKQGMMQ